MGVLRRLQNRLDESKIELETAIALDQNHQAAYLQLGNTLTLLCQPEAAIPQIERALSLNPYNPRFLPMVYFGLGRCHLLLGHVDEAVDLLRKARAANPRFYHFHLHLTAALALKGDSEGARAALAEAIKLKPEICSLARWRAYRPDLNRGPYRALVEKTVDVGLRRAGMPDE
jgi:adenylate cyclase